MVVDDDKDICFTVETIGIYAGWSVYSCLDGQSALAALEVFDPDLIILDYHMPFMNGLTVLTELKTRKPSVIIIMLTVEDDGELAEKCREAGANDFALKPVKALDLIHRVNLNLEVAKLRQDTPMVPVEPLDKGMNRETVDLVLDYSKDKTEFFTINEVADALKIGYSTAHRYLTYLEEKKYLTVRHGYGKQGRPRKKYRATKLEP